MSANQIIAARLEEARLEGERIEADKKAEIERRQRIQEEKEARRREQQASPSFLM